jgi:hypothetical protein
MYSWYQFVEESAKKEKEKQAAQQAPVEVVAAVVYVLFYFSLVSSLSPVREPIVHFLSHADR